MNLPPTINNLGVFLEGILDVFRFETPNNHLVDTIRTNVDHVCVQYKQAGVISGWSAHVYTMMRDNAASLVIELTVLETKHKKIHRIRVGLSV